MTSARPDRMYRWIACSLPVLLLSIVWSIEAAAQDATDPLALAKYLAPLGVGGILAAGMFYFYRQDFMRERQQHQEQIAALVKLVADNATAMSRLVDMEQRELDTIEHVASALSDLKHAVNNLGHVVSLVRRAGGIEP